MVSVTCPCTLCIHNGSDNRCKLDEIKLTRISGYDLKCDMRAVNADDFARALKEEIELEERILNRLYEKISKSIREVKDDC